MFKESPAPVNSPYIGNTLIFSMMFYNLLLRKIRKNAVRISDESIIASFKLAKIAYSKYNSKEDYRLYNRNSDKVFKWKQPITKCNSHNSIIGKSWWCYRVQRFDECNGNLLML